VSPEFLAIRHVEGSSPPSFLLARGGGKELPAVAISSPYEFSVEGRAGSNLMIELRWYLEKFLDYPFYPETLRAEHCLDALESWGKGAFETLFDRGEAGSWLRNAKGLQIRSDDPAILSWPWEALFDPLAGAYVGQQHRMERQLNKLLDLAVLPELPQDRVNILMVVARPFEQDVSYRTVARPLVELIESRGLPAHVDILRPPTFDQLRTHLKEHPGYYHVLHFDGHGAHGSNGGSGGSLQYRAEQGHLVFETDAGKPDPKSASDLSTLLRQYAVPAVVLNACQSASLNDKTEDAFATVATALLRSGMRSVVAMAYSLYVSGAQVFLPAFYGRLFETGRVDDAVLAGREQMLSQKMRMSPRGPCELQDWLLPVLYQQEPIAFSFASQAKVEKAESRLPQSLRPQPGEAEVIGRDGPILEMERALHLTVPAILVQGLGGVGKTTLAREFLRWLDQTGGLDGALWFDFRDINSAEYVLDHTGEFFYGENFRLAPKADKPQLLHQALRQVRVLAVWDNFESATQKLSGGDRNELGRLLDAFHATKSKVIITSRSTEDWLSPSRRLKLPLHGLQSEERWQYCESILRNLGLNVDREDPALSKLINMLGGHPLAMRVVVSKLENASAEKLIAALHSNIAELKLNEQEDEGKLFGTLRFVEQDLPEELCPLLELVALHESYLDADYLEAMAQRVKGSWHRAQIDRLMQLLGTAGLAGDIGSATYRLHPLLTSYLRSQLIPTEPFRKAFAEIMAAVADPLAQRELHEQRIPFLLHGANLAAALEIAEESKLEVHAAALTQALAFFAQKSRNFLEALRLFQRLLDQQEQRSNLEGQAGACHQLGRVAEEQRDFESALKWYVKSLKLEEQRGNLHGAAITYHQLGIVAQEQRDFESARDWYVKSLEIEEQQGKLTGVAMTYHQLGIVAQEQRDFESAHDWYVKSLEVTEQQGTLHLSAGTYHQLGTIAQEQRDFGVARDWYLKSLEVTEQQGNLHGAAKTYHQLGMVAQEQRDFESAREWYLKSLKIEEQQGSLHGAAITYHQLGMVAQEQRDFESAREWYLNSLKIKEQQGTLYGAAITKAQLGILAGLENKMKASVELFIEARVGFLKANDQFSADKILRNLQISHSRSSPEDQKLIEAICQDVGLVLFPSETSS